MGKKKLSIVGKVCIIKTFLISQLVYIMQALVVPYSVLTQVNRLLFRFLWRKKDCNRKAFEKVKRNVVCSDLENGGLGMIDLKQMQTAFCCNGLDVFAKRRGSISGVMFQTIFLLLLEINTCVSFQI